MLLLTTRGFRTGKQRTQPLLYLMDDDTYVVIASYAGRPSNPAWYQNLQHQPNAEIQVKNLRYKVKAETAGPEDRARLWPTITALYQSYDDYQARTQREIPVVFLRKI